MEFASYDAVMKRYGINSFDILINEWSRARFYLALDGMFWNNPKERKKYGPLPKLIDVNTVKAADFWKAFGI